MKFSTNIVLLLLLSTTVVVAQAQETAVQQQSMLAGTCDTEDGATCKNPASFTKKICGIDQNLCQQAGKSSLYSHGGSAQAYVPNAPVKNAVCESSDTKHKVATWPFSRKSRSSAPKLVVRANLWSCSPSSEEKGCCCETLAESTSAKAEVWQTRPNGTYSSLQQRNGDCRATIMPDGGQMEYTTMAPGSTGALGGLGPSGWDVAPYGQPVVHMLLTADNHEPLLIHVPIVPTAKTLEERSFWGGDFRGHAGKKKSSTDAFKVTSWTVVGEAEIHVEIDIFMARGDESVEKRSIEKDLCPSFLYGTPSSFFVEPIAVCAPSLLNFFPL